MEWTWKCTAQSNKKPLHLPIVVPINITKDALPREGMLPHTIDFLVDEIRRAAAGRRRCCVLLRVRDAEVQVTWPLLLLGLGRTFSMRSARRRKRRRSTAVGGRGRRACRRPVAVRGRGRAGSTCTDGRRCRARELHAGDAGDGEVQVGEAGRRRDLGRRRRKAGRRWEFGRRRRRKSGDAEGGEEKEMTARGGGEGISG
jgi:hypothetical protein